MNNGELIELLMNYPKSYEIVIDGSNLFLIEESSNNDDTRQLLFIKK